MSDTQTNGGYIVYGFEPSWFTGKLRTILRSQSIPHTCILKRADIAPDIEARAGTHQIPVLRTPEGWMIADTTPIAHMLNAWFPSSAILPEDPVHRVATMILEDWFDEWWTRPGMYYRWQFEESAAHAKAILGRQAAPEGADATFQSQVGEMVQTWALKACRAIGAEAANGPEIEARFERHLAQLNEHLGTHDFLFGDRPTLADMALGGGFVAHLYADPVPKALVDRIAPRVCDWLDRMWDAAEDHVWPPFRCPAGTPPALVMDWLSELAGDFHARLRINGQALEAGEKGMMLPLKDGSEISLRTMPYLEFSRRFTMARIGELSDEDRAEVVRVLGSTGALKVYGL